MCRPGSKVLSPVRQKRNCAASIAASVLPGLGRGAADQNAQPEVCTGAGGVEAPRPDGPVAGRQVHHGGPGPAPPERGFQGEHAGRVAGDLAATHDGQHAVLIHHGQHLAQPLLCSLWH